MKKLLSWLFVLTIMTSLFVPFAMADTVYQTSGEAWSGDSATFYVKSNGNSSLTLKQTKGQCRGAFLSWNAWVGADKEYGHYHIDVYGSNGRWNTYNWSDRRSGATYKLNFSSTGVYKIVVTAYTYDEMEKMFGDGEVFTFQNWESAPKWWVESYSNCSVSTTVVATVTVQCLDAATGNLIRTSQRNLTPGNKTVNAETISGYTVQGSSSTNVYVDQLGTPTQSLVTFYYSPNSVPDNSNKNIEVQITVEGRNASTNEVLYRAYKDLKPGNTSISARTLGGYNLSSSSSENVYVSKDGTASQTLVVFYYVKKSVPQTNPPPVTQPPVSGGNAYDIGIPNLNGNVYYQDDMNVYVLWVHYQLKATGKYYQGSSWDETGNLGDRTMREIGKFMQDNGYRNHDGHVDQTVINTLANYLGSRRVPVYVGGYYEKMNTIMTGGSAGSMQDIDENSSSTKVKWVQTCLKKLGYYNSSIDGRFGSGTIRALKSFQADHGFEQRDYVSLGVARALLEAYYDAGYNLNDLP